jgi:DNA-binding NarL/FixJ family response regulator
MQSTTSVLILGGDRIFTEALEAVLAMEEDLCMLAAPANGGNGNGQGCPIDILLIDASFDHATALAWTWSAREQFPGIQIMVIGLESEDEGVLDFIEAGAAAYVLRRASPARLVEAIRALREGEVHSSPHIAAAVLERIAALEKQHDPEPLPTEEPLTARELETLALLARGLRNKEIAQSLRITVQTVKNHVHKILEKLRVHRRRDAVRLAYELGLLHEPRDPLDLF